ncbi:aspartic peptidase A1 family [Artemisia annua]|uniref:Aspartic peptidase A1 family n=1 Tax=Artemisia annua TaxID=35608 RepID=A0A2U1L8D4_ARTAN|nr:aspartic peptidase A1 family [Artemisia annua]
MHAYSVIHQSITPLSSTILLVMASSIFFVSPILLVILFHLLLAKEPTCYASNRTVGTQTGFRAPLTRVGLGKNRPHPPMSRYTQNALSNDRNGKENLPGLPVTFPMKEFKDVYTMNIKLGTPPVPFSAIMDTGSDLIWTKCKPDKKSSPGYFDPSKSSSYVKANESCDFYQLPGCKQKYVDGSVTVALGQEAITIGSTKIPDVIFACGKPSEKQFKDYDGVVGMGRGKLSLVSQLDQHVFSYCLASRFEVSKPSMFLTESLASSALENTKTSIQTMPLLKQEGKPYYYISLEGISVGGTRLPVTKSDFAINNANNDGGMIIDSGTTFTYLEERIVDMIYNEFINQTKLEKLSSSYYKELKHCFKPPNKNNIIPNLVFHFEGANWELPRENYIYQKKEAMAKACLAFIANTKSDKLSIFGNMQQQNMMVLYNLDSNNLSFGPAKCHEL